MILHKAAGGENRHRPKYWLKLDQTEDLKSELEKGGIPPVSVETGRNGGTYVVKELITELAGQSAPGIPGVPCRHDRGAKRHQPSNWLQLDQTKDLIAEIETAGITAVSRIEGRNGGTYVVKELVLTS